MPDGDDEPSEEPGEDHDPRDIEDMTDEAPWGSGWRSHVEHPKPLN